MYNYGTNRETLLLLAWCSTLDLRALLQQDQQARPHKYPQYQKEYLPLLPEDVLVNQIKEALGCFRDGPYDPVFLDLVNYRLLFVDVEEVAHAIGMKDLVRPSHALFYTDDPVEHYTVEKQRAQGPASETDAFLQAISQPAPLQECLMKHRQIWSNNVCLGAHALHTLFLGYARIMLGHREVPFFVAEFLGWSLQQVDWHAIAAHIQGLDTFCCECSTSEPSREHEGAVHIPLFQELLTLASEEIWQGSRRLPDHLRSNALFLSDLCRDTASICKSSPQ